MSKKKPKKEYTTFNGVRNSFIATVSLVKHTWSMTPDEAVGWYIKHVQRQGRGLTAQTAETYKFELGKEFVQWINKNGSVVSSNDIDAAVKFLEENGYTVSK